MVFTLSILTLLVTAFLPIARAAGSKSFTPKTIEVDLIFPRNGTFAPLQSFPLLWGQQNARTAWKMGTMLSWELSQIDDVSNTTHPVTGVWPPFYYSADGVPASFTEWPAPTDPFFMYYFPDSLQNFAVGRWKLSWKFGFQYTCNHTIFMYDQYNHVQPEEVIFQIAEGGTPVDLLAIGNSTCPESYVTAQILDYEYSSNTLGHACSTLNQTAPEANPCALKFNQTLVDEMNAGAANNCSSEDWNRFVHTCQISGAPGLAIQEGLEIFGLVAGISFLSMFLF